MARVLNQVGCRDFSKRWREYFGKEANSGWGPRNRVLLQLEDCEGKVEERGVAAVEEHAPQPQRGLGRDAAYKQRQEPVGGGLRIVMRHRNDAASA